MPQQDGRRIGSVLVLISGLNGTGKSTLAKLLVARLGAAQTMVIAEPLECGRPVIVEGVLSRKFRAELTNEAHSHSALVFRIECVCSNRKVHRDRVDARYAAGASGITWQHLRSNERIYEAASAPDYVADSMHPIASHVEHIVAALAHRGRGSP